MCQSCNSCNDCNTCLYKCQLARQLVSEERGERFRFRDNYLSKDDLFLTTDEWNGFLEYIWQGYRLQDAYKSSFNEFAKYSGGNIDIRAGSGYNKIMTANMYNGAYEKMRYLSYDGSGYQLSEAIKVNPGDIIYAKLFNHLADYANYDFYIPKGSRCVDCDDCNACISSCEGVNGCCEPPPAS